MRDIGAFIYLTSVKRLELSCNEFGVVVSGAVL